VGPRAVLDFLETFQTILHFCTLTSLTLEDEGTVPKSFIKFNGDILLPLPTFTSELWQINVSVRVIIRGYYTRNDKSVP